MKAAHSDRQPEPVKLSGSAGPALALELRHLRYFAALADGPGRRQAWDGSVCAWSFRLDCPIPSRSRPPRS